MAWPTWNSLAEKAINSMPTWGKEFATAELQNAYRIKIASVEASWWAVGKSQQEIESEAARRLMEGE